MTVKHKLPVSLAIFITGLILFYNFSYHFPLTNNAFVVANIRPVAANVTGYITTIYIKNADYVKKGQPLFTVFKKPYELAYTKAVSDVGAADARLITRLKQVEKTQHLIQSQQSIYNKLDFDYQRYASALREHAVSEIRTKNLSHEKNAALGTLNALKKELEINRQAIIVERMSINALTAVMENAKVNLDETTVYAKNNGIVQNMFVSLGTPIDIRKPIFSFVDTESMFIQANFNETDLRFVHEGNCVTIYTRMYFGSRVYHGIVTSRNWAASRQVTDHRSQEQIVTNSENNWFLLPQRFPVQIKIIDYDPVHFPLGIGASAYVYIHT